MPIHAQFYPPTIWTRKVGQVDLVFDVQLGCASGSVCARLQVSVYSGYDLCHPGCPKMFLLPILTPVTPKSKSNPRQLLHPCQVHPWCKFGDCRSVACRDNADISIFYNALKSSKLGQGDLVFGLQGLFTSMSLCATFQISVSSGYDLWHHLMSQRDRQTVFVQSIWVWVARWVKNDFSFIYECIWNP